MHGLFIPPVCFVAQHGPAIIMSIMQFIGHGQKPHDLGRGGLDVKMQHGQHMTMQCIGICRHGTQGSQQLMAVGFERLQEVQLEVSTGGLLG